MRILHLTLKKKWFDMIASGEKKEEYREIKLYWAVRLLYGFDKTAVSFNLKDLSKPYKTTSGETLFDAVKKSFDAIEFTNGYSSNSPKVRVECTGIDFRPGKEEWGALPGVEYFVIKLGNIIKT